MSQDYEVFQHNERFINEFPKEYSLGVKKPIPYETARCKPGSAGGWLARMRGTETVVFSGDTEEEAIAELTFEIAGNYYGLINIRDRLSSHLHKVLELLEEYVEPVSQTEGEV